MEGRPAVLVHVDRGKGVAVASTYDGDGRLAERKACGTALVEVEAKGPTRVRVPPTLSEDQLLVVVEGPGTVDCAGGRLVVRVEGDGGSPAKG